MKTEEITNYNKCPVEAQDAITKIIRDYENKLIDSRSKFILMEEKYRLLLDKIYGRKSEKHYPDDDQPNLFNEAELAGITSTDEKEDEEIIEVAGYERKKPSDKKEKKRGGKIELPADLPREEIIYDLSDDEKKCPDCDKERPLIGNEVNEYLDIEPIKFKVVRQVRLKYGPCKCDNFAENEETKTIVTAKKPERIIPRSQVSEKMLAFILVSKFCDALPFYRQEMIFKKRYNITVPRSKMCYWALKIGRKVQDLLELMWKRGREGPFIQMDETTVQVLNEPGRIAQSKSYMWVTRTVSETGKGMIFFNYFPGRNKEIPVLLLGDYNGYLQTDGYKGYNDIFDKDGIKAVGCWAHARRYFINADKVSKNKKSEKVALSYIKSIYIEENKLRKKLENEEITEDEFVQLRKEAVDPVLKKFKKWLDKKVDTVLPKSKLGEAITYTLNQWNKLVSYLEASFITPDNNLCENAIRPFVVGRKNWLFSEIPQGAHASAAIYSLIESAKANNLEPYSYLVYLFNKLPQIKNNAELEKLMPINLTTVDLTGQ